MGWCSLHPSSTCHVPSTSCRTHWCNSASPSHQSAISSLWSVLQVTYWLTNQMTPTNLFIATRSAFGASAARGVNKGYRVKVNSFEVAALVLPATSCQKIFAATVQAVCRAATLHLAARRAVTSMPPWAPTSFHTFVPRALSAAIPYLDYARRYLPLAYAAASTYRWATKAPYRPKTTFFRRRWKKAYRRPRRVVYRVSSRRQRYRRRWSGRRYARRHR